MFKNKSLLLFITAFFILQNCGYKKLNQIQGQSFHIQKLEIKGDNRISHYLKNTITINSNETSKNKISLKLKINKKKDKKEKNISKKITKYVIILTVDLKLEEANNVKIVNKSFTRAIDLNVKSNHSDTITEEIKNVDNISEKISEDIVRFLKMYYRE